jgi:RimJ/RimL family protein N-acetyltransferase
MSWPAIETVLSERLRLEPISIDHAPEMVEVLADASIYEFTGGEAPTLEQLQRRIALQEVGHSPDLRQGWFNWIVKAKDDDVPMGFVQASLERNQTQLTANIAWVIKPTHQGQGVASEATTAMSDWLQARGVTSLVAYIHPDHHASIGVARKQGLHPTSLTEDGEVRWES